MKQVGRTRTLKAFLLPLAGLVAGLVIHDSAAQDVRTCNAEPTPINQVICFGRLAKAQGDRAVCDKAKHRGVKYQCYYVLAQSKNDTALCGAIPDTLLRDGCLSDIAALRGEAPICSKIETTGVKDSCYLKVAKKTGRQELCAQITDAGLKSTCSGQPVVVH